MFFYQKNAQQCSRIPNILYRPLSFYSQPTCGYCDNANRVRLNPRRRRRQGHAPIPSQAVFATPIDAIYKVVSALGPTSSAGADFLFFTNARTRQACHHACFNALVAALRQTLGAVGRGQSILGLSKHRHRRSGFRQPESRFGGLNIRFAGATGVEPRKPLRPLDPRHLFGHCLRYETRDFCEPGATGKALRCRAPTATISA